MAEQQPCAEFTVPPDGLYRAYCNRCGFSREAHDHWDEWAVAGSATPTTEDDQ
jgi:hypothetical protein